MIGGAKVQIPPEIKDLRLFGSVARADDDFLSDVDVLIVADAQSDKAEKFIHSVFESRLTEKISISWYSTSKMRNMFQSGDLFAWHVYLESKMLCTAFDFLQSLGAPKEYSGARETYFTFRSLLNSIKSHIEANDTSLIYESGLLYTAIRNIAMALSWHGSSGLNFSRGSPFAVSSDFDIQFPINLDEYAALAACRLKVQRGFFAESPSRAWLLSTCISLMDWSDEIWNRVENSKQLISPSRRGGAARYSSNSL